MTGDGLVQCVGCSAQFNPLTAWKVGSFDRGSANVFTLHGIIPAGTCPICRQRHDVSKRADGP